MCWLRTEMPLQQRGESACGVSRCSAARQLAARLRQIGDQLDRDRAADERHAACACPGCAPEPPRSRSGPGHHLLSLWGSALHVVVLVLVVSRRHL